MMVRYQAPRRPGGLGWDRFATFATYPGLLRLLVGLGQDMSDFSDLPAGERAKRYRQLAEDALREAEQAEGAVRQSYLLIAEQWNRLAQVDGGHLDFSRVS